MAEVKLNLSRTNPTQLIIAMKTHAALAAPPPPATPPIANMTDAVTSLNTKIAAADAANDAYEAAKAALSSLKTERDIVADALRAEAALFVKKAETECMGEPGPLQALGFQIAGASPTPPPSLAPPGNLIVTAGQVDGSVNAQCDPSAPKATIRSFKWQYTTVDPINGPYVDAPATTAPRTTISGLPSGTRVWIRVCVITTHGTTAWSDPATKIVP